MNKIGCVNHDCENCQKKAELSNLERHEQNVRNFLGAPKATVAEQHKQEPKREWVGLTDDEIDELHGSPMELEPCGALEWVRMVEAKLKEKNT